MPYIYTPSYLVIHRSPYPQQQLEQPAWPPALDLGNQYYPAPLYSSLSLPLYSSLSLPLSPTPRAPSPPIPIYNVSYSLAGAMTPVEEPELHPASPHCCPAIVRPAQPLRYAETEGSSLSPQSLRYSPDVTSPKESVYEPDINRSSLSTSSVKEEDVFSEFSESCDARAPGASNTPPQAGKSPRAAGTQASHGRRAKGHMTQEDDNLPPQMGEQPYNCDVCGAHFMRKYDMERHRRSHTGERPFPCHGGCGKVFRRADARSRHWSVYRDCEWQHTLFLEGTPEGLRRNRRIRKRAKRAELVAQCVPQRMIESILKKM